MNWKNLKVIGILLTIGGVMLFLDGIGSTFLWENFHDFWSDTVRLFRALGGILLSLLGIFFINKS